MKTLTKLALATSIVTTAFVSSIASAAITDFSSEAGKAVIYVYQDESNAQPEGISLELNDEFLGVLNKDTFVKMVVEPGEHTLLSRSENLPELAINAEADMVYYIRKDISLGKHEQSSSLEVVESDIAQQAITNAEQIN